MKTWVLALMLTAPLLAAPRFSGVLGQSQPADAPPFPAIGANGAVVDAAGRLWTAVGGTLYGFDLSRAGTPLVAKTLALPAPVGGLAPRSDGKQLYYLGGGRFYRVDTASGQTQRLGEATVSEQAKAFAVAPATLAAGFAQMGKLFVLDGEQVNAYGPQGEPRGKVLALARPAGATWSYTSVGLEPRSGDLLVGSYYPDSKVYRFAADGHEVTRDGWPRTGHSASLDIASDLAWALRYGSGAFALPDKPERGAVTLEIGAEWTQYVNGLAAAPPGGYWLAGSQGLVRYDARGRGTGLRLGGLDGVRGLAIAADGTVIAAVEGGQRMVRLGLDDEPSAPLRSSANEPWRCGAGWSARAVGLAWDGQQFLAADETAGQLWRFDPWRTAWGEKPWIALGEPRTLTKPTAVAASDQHLWVLDGDRLLEAARPDLAKLSPVASAGLPGLTALAAVDDDRLAVATDQSVALLRREAGAWRPVWQAALPGVTALAADGDHIAAGTATGVALLATASGQSAGELRATDVPGGWQPGPLALRGPWLVVADRQGRRLVRCRL